MNCLIISAVGSFWKKREKVAAKHIDWEKKTEIATIVSFS